MNEKLAATQNTLREESFDRLFASYQTKAKSFRSAFVTTLIFSFAFFLFILFPYFGSQIAERNKAKRIGRAEAEIESANKNIAAYKESIKGLAELKKALDDSPSELRGFVIDMLRGSEAGNTPTASSPVTNPAIQSAPPRDHDLESAKTSNEKVRDKVLSQIVNYEEIVQQRIMGPLSAELTSDFDRLQNEVSKLRPRAMQMLRDDPKFWSSFDGKVEFTGELSEEFEAVRRAINDSASSERKLLDKQVSTLKDGMQVLQEEQEKLGEQRAELSKRLDNIKSPMGNLPVGLSESILVFPVLLAVGYVLMSLFYRDALRIRAELYQLYRMKDPEKTTLTDGQFSLIAPLWLDPLNPEQSKLGRLVLTILPLSLFFVSTSLIVYSWTASSELTAVPNSREIYGALYVASTIAIIISVRHVANDFLRAPSSCES